MATTKQRTANQQNARRSTGPKTEAGKRNTSLNAIRHGLTSSVGLDLCNPRLAQLYLLIQTEIADELLAQTIATKVLEYERIEAYQMEVAAKESRGEDGFLDETALEKVQAEGMATAFLAGQVEARLEENGLGKHRKEELKVYKKSLDFLAKVALHKERLVIAKGSKEFIRLRRYFKRASNQMIKAIKAASCA